MRARERAGDDLGELARRRRTCSAARPGRARACRRRRSSSGTTTSPSASSACLHEQRDLAPSRRSRRPSDGSRSKSTKSGRSGRSTREYHAFMSMQPMFTIQSSASSSFTSGASIQLRFARRLARRDLDAEARDPVRHVLRRVLLEERLAERAVGVAPHRERPVAEVRHEHRRDRAVVVEQVALRDPLVRPEELVEVGELHARLPLRTRSAAAARAAHRGPACRRGGPGSDGARRWPSCVHSANSTSQTSSRLDPDDVALRAPSASSARPANGDVVRAQRLELREQLARSRVAEAGADVADPVAAPAAVNAEHERAEACRRAGPGPSCSRRSRTPAGRAS